MKILVQRVREAHIDIQGKTISSIGNGVVVFLGITHTDGVSEANWLANKLVNLRLFEDSSGKINASLIDKTASVLIVSQFTLYADCNGGRRPSFTQAASPNIAQPIYEQFIAEVRTSGLHVETGVFGAEMQVSLINDGPVT